MEKMLISLLKEQGYEYIGVFDTEKDIWGYVKDGKFHFCHDNLVEVDRSTIGNNSEVLVITKAEDKLLIVEHEQEISTYVVIDSNNSVLSKKTENDYRKNCCLRINSKSIIIKEKEKSDYLSDNELGLYKKYNENVRPANQIVIINEATYPKTGLWKIYGNVYILVSDSETMIHNGKELVKLGWCPPIWKHKDGTMHCLSIVEQENRLEYTTIANGRIETNTIDLHLVKEQLIDSFRFHSDKYLIITLYWGKNKDWKSIEDSVLVISYETPDIITYPIYFTQNGKMPVAFTNDILIREQTYWDDHEYEVVDSIELYDIKGNQLELPNIPVSKLYGETIFSISNTGMFSNIEKLYGVVSINRQWAKVVIPPIFEKILEVSCGVYKVQYGNYVWDKYHQFEDLYTFEDGFIHADIYQFKYTNIINGKSIWANTPCEIVVFTKDKKMGVIEYGKITIDALMDEICGFDFSDKYIGERGNLSIDEIETKTREYTPGCLILRNEGKYGLYINKENIIMPIYDYIKCVKITGENARYNDETRIREYNKHAYFEVKKGNKVGIISDNPEYNKISKVEYDEVEVIDKYNHAAYFKVYKDGKVGLISSNKVGENYFALPTKYDQLDIIAFWGWYGDIEPLFIADGYIYNMKGEKLLEAEHHAFKGSCYEEDCIVFKNTEAEDYIFINYSNNKELEAEGRDKDGNIILSDKCKFDVNDEKFIIQEEENDDQNDWDWRREIEAERESEKMEIETGWQTAFGDDPESEWNID